MKFSRNKIMRIGLELVVQSQRMVITRVGWPHAVKPSVLMGSEERIMREPHGFHNLSVTTDSSDPKKSDDMYNYQCSLLEFGFIIISFYDAISEGDGLRVFRCWKFMLPYLRQDGAASRKYALEALYLLFQAYALLSPRDAPLNKEQFYKLKQGSGGNIPLDLALEQYNNVIKTLMRKMGPNATNKRALSRLIKALTTNKRYWIISM